MISLTGTAVYRWLAQAGAWRGEARADALPIDRLANVSPRAQGWRGALSGTATLAGSPRAPEFEVRPRLEGRGAAAPHGVPETIPRERTRAMPMGFRAVAAACRFPAGAEPGWAPRRPDRPFIRRGLRTVPGAAPA